MQLIYNKTVENNKLVYKGQGLNKFFLFLSQFILLGSGIYLIVNICSSQLKGNPSIGDYFVSLFFPLLILVLLKIFIDSTSKKDKLKEIEINIGIQKAKTKFLKVGKNLGWILYEQSDNHLLFLVKFNRIYQYVTIVYFPDNRVYFNSSGVAYNYLKRSRFDENYELFIQEYIKIEKDNKQL